MANITKTRPFDKIEIIRKCTGLSSTQKLILLILATHIGDNNFCFLSFSTLQRECCLAKRTALADNLTSLIDAKIIWKILPGDGFKSNRYGIDFQKLVTDGYQCSNPRLPVRSPTVTRVVTVGHPKRNINKIKQIKEKPFCIKDEKSLKAKQARDEYRRLCGLKGDKHVG